MFSFHRQLAAVLVTSTICAAGISGTALAEETTVNSIKAYLDVVVEQNMIVVKAELQQKAIQEVALAAYHAEPEISSTTLIADVEINDLEPAQVFARADQGE